ncbi:MAG: bifunctional oligoribonuclease/PAP phosphatase NrnA [Bacilli bacterium]|nr:bifunctional oligoribonuclease/PAP phosphatase NrnA [Bacilli bacterium]
MSNRLNQVIVDYGKARIDTYRKIYRAIKRYDRIVIFRHIKPDFDAFGSQLGLAQFIKDNFPNKEVHVVGDNHVSFTGRIYPEMEELSNEFFKDRNFLAIVLDVGDHHRIADPRYKNAKYIVKIDHHPCRAEITKKCALVDLDISAASELVADVILNWKGTTLSKEAAKWLYTGIVGDSGRFMYSSTNQHTFAVAEELIKTGININEIYQVMYEKGINNLYVTAYILNSFKLSEHGVAYYVMSDETQKKLNITSELGKENINLFSNIRGINVWCSFSEDVAAKEPTWWVSIRSKKKDISGIAAKWHGGGHAQASGARISGLHELDALIKDLDDLFVEEN